MKQSTDITVIVSALLPFSLLLQHNMRRRCEASACLRHAYQMSHFRTLSQVDLTCMSLNVLPPISSLTF